MFLFFLHCVGLTMAHDELVELDRCVLFWPLHDRVNPQLLVKAKCHLLSKVFI